MGMSPVIPGRSAAEGKGIQPFSAHPVWIPFPALRAAGDDTRWTFSLPCKGRVGEWSTRRLILNRPDPHPASPLQGEKTILDEPTRTPHGHA